MHMPSAVAEVGFHPIADIFPRLAEHELQALSEDIGRNGLRIPITRYEGKILDGRNRYLACQRAGVEPRFDEYTGGDPLGWVISMNLHRRHLNTSQRAMIAARLANMRQGERTDLSGNTLRSQPQAAAEFNVSLESVKCAKKVMDKAEPEVVEAVTSGHLPVSQGALLADSPPEFQRAVIEKINREQIKPMEAIRRVKAEMTSAKRIEFPTGKFRVLYADPPWSYGNTMPDEFREQRDHYPVMSLDDLCAMPVESMAEDDAVLFLWVTSPILEEAFTLIRSWGFKYKASFVWDKQKHVMGHYNSVRHEFLLVCVRGSCQPDVRKLFDSVVSEERTVHSRKPDIFYEIIEALYRHGMRIELFARNRRQGWETYGYESDKFDQLHN